jgi:hypothetical protein
MGLTRPRAHQLQDIDYKQTSRAITTTNITLSGGAPAVVDGVSLGLNDRVLVTGQSTGSENGIYSVTTVGAGSNGTWARSSDADGAGELNAGSITMVTEGTTYADTQWKLTTDDPITIGSTALTFVRNGAAAYGVFAVAGQSDIVADVVGDTLTVVAGTNIALTTNDSTDTLTITPSLTPALTTATFTNTTTDDTILLTTTEDSSTAGPVITLKRNSASPADADYLGQLKFQGENDADQEVVYAKITGKIQDASDGSEDGLLEFANMKAGSNVITARLRSDSLQLLNGTTLVVAGLTYPTADGTSGQAIITDASGNLSFGDVSGGGTGRVTFNYAITGTPTTVTGADSNGDTLAYTAGQIDVFVNGVRMAPVDITATNGTSVVFGSALANSDVVDIITYTTFDVVTNNADDLSSGTVPDARFPATLPAISGANLTNLDATDLTGTIASARIAGAYTGITSVGTLTGFTSTGIDDNADATAITIDSSENVGIGTTSPSSFNQYADNLVVGTTSGENGITIASGSANSGRFVFSDNATGAGSFVGAIEYAHSSDAMILYTGATERMRITSAGKVGLGIDPSTLPAFVNHAMKISNGGGLSITSPSAGDNRLIFFGTGTLSADVQLAGIKNTSSDFIFLGESGAERFKIHNNGVVAPLNGIALGVGTANTASNVLDDYEEGIWIPSIGGNASYTYQDGVYTKIGNMVHLQCRFQVNVIGTGSTNVLSGLPFASNNSWTSGSLSVEYYNSIATSMVWVSGYVTNNASDISFSGNSASATTIGHNGFAIFGNSARVDFQCSYRTA